MSDRQQDIERMTRAIVERFHPAKVVLFGSRARGKGFARPSSDIDVMVILPFECSSYEMAVDLYRAIAPIRGVDILARTPADVERRYREGDPFVRAALDEGRVLFEAAA